jgi:hypothetical protein
MFKTPLSSLQNDYVNEQESSLHVYMEARVLTDFSIDVANQWRMKGTFGERYLLASPTRHKLIRRSDADGGPLDAALPMQMRFPTIGPLKDPQDERAERVLMALLCNEGHHKLSDHTPKAHPTPLNRTRTDMDDAMDDDELLDRPMAYKMPSIDVYRDILDDDDPGSNHALYTGEYSQLTAMTDDDSQLVALTRNRNHIYYTDTVRKPLPGTHTVQASKKHFWNAQPDAQCMLDVNDQQVPAIVIIHQSDLVPAMCPELIRITHPLMPNPHGFISGDVYPDTPADAKYACARPTRQFHAVTLYELLSYSRFIADEFARELAQAHAVIDKQKTAIDAMPKGEIRDDAEEQYHAAVRRLRENTMDAEILTDFVDNIATVVRGDNLTQSTSAPMARSKKLRFIDADDLADPYTVAWLQSIRVVWFETVPFVEGSLGKDYYYIHDSNNNNLMRLYSVDD